METLKIIIDKEGKFESVLADGEVNVEVLRRGTHDTKIDKFETILDIVEL